MRVLWSINTLFPTVADYFGVSSGHANSWVDAMANSLSKKDSIKLGIVVFINIENRIKGELDNIIYYLLPTDKIEKEWEFVLSDFVPDIIHAYGTEQNQNYYLVKNFRDKFPIIISLQGIINAYKDHYFAGLSPKEIKDSISIRGRVLGDEISKGQEKFIQQSEVEKYILKNVRFVEGRSKWDDYVSKSINPQLQYYYCPRMIREPFYRYRWDKNSFRKNSILIHQGTYPIKGLHIFLNAVEVIKDKYPDLKIYICGVKPKYRDRKIRKFVSGTYVNIIFDKIEEYGLQDIIEYTGILNAEEVASLLSSVNLCINTSAIENVPNSVAEAMLVGTPVIASYVGGTPEMLGYGSCGWLYPYDDPYYLASLIDKVLQLGPEVIAKTKESRKIALERHDQKMLTKRIIEIYEEVISTFCG